MKKKLLYIMFSIIILGGIICLGVFIYNNKIGGLREIGSSSKSRVGYTVTEEYEVIDITPVHTGYNVKITNEKGPEFYNERDCKKRVDKEAGRVCYNNINPEDWVGFYMGDTEPRPVFKTYEECEDWAISMMPYSLVEKAQGGVHAGDGDTRCSQGCHYTYKFLDRRTWIGVCDKTVHSMIGLADKFEKIMDKLDEGWDYDRFRNAFGNDSIECDIKIKNNDEVVYSYFVGIGHEINASRHDVRAHSKDKIMTRQKNQKDGKIFYVQQMDGVLYVRGDIYNKSIGKIYEIEDGNDDIIFSNIKQLFENEDIEISCNNDFGRYYSSSEQGDFYSLPQDIEWIEAGNIDNIYYRLYED